MVAFSGIFNRHLLWSRVIQSIFTDLIVSWKYGRVEKIQLENGRPNKSIFIASLQRHQTSVNILAKIIGLRERFGLSKEFVSNVLKVIKIIGYSKFWKKTKIERMENKDIPLFNNSIQDSRDSLYRSGQSKWTQWWFWIWFLLHDHSTFL